MVRISALVGVLLLAASCVHTYTLVEPTRTTIAYAYSIEPQIRWSAVQLGKYSAWTVDGFKLHRLRFTTGLEEGEPLSMTPGDERRPTFRRGMTSVEIAEIFVDDVRLGGNVVEMGGIRPQRFGSADGFRFNLKIVSGDGLEGEVLVVGAMVNDKLHLIDYLSYGHYHFEKYQAAVERLIESIRLQ
jgi:hypothetical protein